jgi:hypothetical protein
MIRLPSARMMTFSNCSTSLSRPSVETLYWYAWPAGAGGCPMAPAATCTFCCLSAPITSMVVRSRDLSCSGSSHTRMP